MQSSPLGSLAPKCKDSTESHQFKVLPRETGLPVLISLCTSLWTFQMSLRVYEDEVHA